MISTLGPWALLEKQGDGWSYRLRPPEEALRSEPGILSGEPKAVLKAVAFALVLGEPESTIHEWLGLTLLSTTIAGLEPNKDSRMALNSYLREVQVCKGSKARLCV